MKENIDLVVKDGARPAASSRAVAEECAGIVTMLPNSPRVKTVVVGENGILEGAIDAPVFGAKIGK